MTKIKLDIQIPKEDKEDVLSAFNTAGVDSQVMNSENFDGGGVLSFIIELTPQILPFLAGLYVARMNANKHISYKYKGVEVKGVSEKMLKELFESQNKSSSENKHEDN
jgi:hypothetical protein